MDSQDPAARRAVRRNQVESGEAQAERRRKIKEHEIGLAEISKEMLHRKAKREGVIREHLGKDLEALAEMSTADKVRA